jgi:hypothetical protein
LHADTNSSGGRGIRHTAPAPVVAFGIRRSGSPHTGHEAGLGLFQRCTARANRPMRVTVG